MRGGADVWLVAQPWDRDTPIDGPGLLLYQICSPGQAQMIVRLNLCLCQTKASEELKHLRGCVMTTMHSVHLAGAQGT